MHQSGLTVLSAHLGSATIVQVLHKLVHPPVMRTKLPERSEECFLLLYVGMIPDIPVPCIGKWSSRVNVHLVWLLIPTPALSAVLKSRCWKAKVYLQCRISLCLSWDKFSHTAQPLQKTCNLGYSSPTTGYQGFISARVGSSWALLLKCRPAKW